jgi:DNA-binding NtrC family response regulator
MYRGRILPLAGPALVLYLIAEIAGSDADLDAAALVTFAFALALSSLPLWLLRRESGAGLRRVSMASALSGIALVRCAKPELSSMYLDYAHAISLSALGSVVLHLAFNAPDRLEAFGRRRSISIAIFMLALASAVLSSLAFAPSFVLFGELVLVTPLWAHSAQAFAAIAIAIALVRRRVGTAPDTTSSGLWAQLGSAAALAIGIAMAILIAVGSLDAASTPARILWNVALAALVLGHVAMLGARRDAHAGRSARNVLAGAIAFGTVAAVAARFVDEVPRDPFAIGVMIALSVASALILYRAAAAFLHRALAPFRGRLLEAADEALEGSRFATSFEELAESVLPPLRRGSGALDGEPAIWTIDPPRRVRVDAAGVAHVEEREPSPAIVAHATERFGEVIVREPLVRQVVRRSDLRPLVDALDTCDALCVVPLALERELEGFLIVPRGKRRSALTLEEMDRLEKLARHLAAQVALLSAQERARVRTRDAVLSRDRTNEELETAREEIEKLRADARILKAGGAPERYVAPAIAYSPAMRELTKRAHQVGPHDAPVLLHAEEGTPLETLAHLVHEASGRREGPFVVADCAAVRPERAEAALFGEGDGARPGWLRLAEGGTCVLLDVPALSREAQAKLAEAIATRRTTPANSGAAYAVDARVVATTRVDLALLVQASAFDAELQRRFEPLTLEVPPLRLRKEDIPSLVLVALDRSCRTAGRPVMGIDPEALEVLVAHDWPGDQRELTSVIDRAVEQARGKNVRAEDLPPLARARAVNDPWTGTYAELEARIMENALHKARGNKAEAARILDIKRSTFVAKLKKYGLVEGEKAEPPPEPTPLRRRSTEIH